MTLSNPIYSAEKGGANPLFLKVGDVAVVKDPGKNKNITKGKEYVVLEVRPGNGGVDVGVIVLDDAEREQFYYAHRFTKVEGKASFGTGKGTTEKIRDFFRNRTAAYSVADIGTDIGLPSRQLSKRLAELVKRGELVRSISGGFQRATV